MELRETGGSQDCIIYPVPNRIGIKMYKLSAVSTCTRNEKKNASFEKRVGGKVLHILNFHGHDDSSAHKAITYVV